MGMPGPMELGMILVVVMLIFGTSRLRSVGKDLGGAIKDFKSGLSGDDDNDSQKPPATSSTEAEEKPAE